MERQLLRFDSDRLSNRDTQCSRRRNVPRGRFRRAPGFAWQLDQGSSGRD